MNPGSKEAIDNGCLCPISDNRYGKGMYISYNGPVFVVTENCPLHHAIHSEDKKDLDL